MANKRPIVRTNGQNEVLQPGDTLPAAIINGTASASDDGLMTSADKTKLDAIDAGATVNQEIVAGPGLGGGGSGDSVSLYVGSGDGITVLGDTVGLDTAHARNVDHSAVSITAGTGLSGGGTIAASRTLSVVYGTAAGTSAQGNDARLSNSREWNATTISEAEAEAGTATTRRAWTAQRVRQAIAAWWATITLTKADVGLGNVDNTSDANKPVSTATQTALALKVEFTDVRDELVSTAANVPLSANQGRILKTLIDDLNAILTSNDVSLDEIQEIVDYIKQNRADLQNLAISNIAGLESALAAKQDTITGAASTVTSANLSANRVVISDGSGKIAASSITTTLLGYLSGLTSSIQTQLNSKANNSDLGTGAYGNLTTAFNDTTSGRILRVGDFGLGRLNSNEDGAFSPKELTSLSLLTDAEANGFYAYTTSSTDLPVTDGYGSMLSATRRASEGQYGRIAFNMSPNNVGFYGRVKKSNADTGWVMFWHSGNLANPVKVGDYGLGTGGPQLSNVDLDTITAFGLYTIVDSLSTNTPIAGVGGWLRVTVNNWPQARPAQEFFAYGGTNHGRIFYRTVINTSGHWGAWTEQWNTNTLVKTASETDTTEGRMVKVGDYGLGVGQGLVTNTDIGTLTTPGVYYCSSTCSDKPYLGSGGGILQVMAGSYSGANDRPMQMWTSIQAASMGRTWHRVYEADLAAPAWSSWFESWNSSNLSGTPVSTSDYQELIYSSEGWYTIAHGSTRCFSEFYLSDSVSGRHNFCKLTASTSFGQSRLTSEFGTRFSGNTFFHARILYKTSSRTSGGARLQIYCQAGPVKVQQQMHKNIVSWMGWSLVTPYYDNAPADWTLDPDTLIYNINTNSMVTRMIRSDHLRVGNHDVWHAGNLDPSTKANTADLGTIAGLSSTDFVRRKDALQDGLWIGTLADFPTTGWNEGTYSSFLVTGMSSDRKMLLGTVNDSAITTELQLHDGNGSPHIALKTSNTERLRIAQNGLVTINGLAALRQGDYGLGSTEFGSGLVLTSGSLADATRPTGFYRYSTSVSDRPSSTNGTLIQITRGSTTISIIAIDDDNKMFTARWDGTSALIWQEAWTSGNQPVSAANVANTLAKRDGGGDLVCRLVRQEYPTQTGTTFGYVYVSRAAGGVGTDNYLRPTSVADFASKLGALDEMISGQKIFTKSLKVNGGSNFFPALTSATDADTGVYFPTNGETAISSDGNQIARFDSTQVKFDRNFLVDNGQNSTIQVNADNGGEGELIVKTEAGANSRLALHVDSTSVFGGGIEYIGSSVVGNNSGAGSTNIALFRDYGGTRSWTARNTIASNKWEFRETPNVGTSAVWHEGNLPVTVSGTGGLFSLNGSFDASRAGDTFMRAVPTAINSRAYLAAYGSEGGSADVSATAKDFYAHGGGFGYTNNGGSFSNGSAGDGYVGVFRQRENARYWTARILTTSNNWEFRGSVTATSFPTSSARKYKKNVSKVDNALSRVKQVEVIKYKRRTSDKDDKTYLGVTAESLALVAPELVVFDDNGEPDAVIYGQLAALCVQALKEQEVIHARDTQYLESRLEAIEAELSKSKDFVKPKKKDAIGPIAADLPALETLMRSNNVGGLAATLPAMTADVRELNIGDIYNEVPALDTELIQHQVGYLTANLPPLGASMVQVNSGLVAANLPPLEAEIRDNDDAE